MLLSMERLCCLLLLAWLCAIAPNLAEVHDFDLEKFPALDRDGGAKPAVLFFFAPWCAHSKKILPIFAKTAKVRPHTCY